MEEYKTLKEYCREAKKRLKSGFWESYEKDLSEKITEAEKVGKSANKIREYYSERVIVGINKKSDEKEQFYQKVKTLLDTEGEVSNAIGRLTEKEYYNKLSYSEQQSYNLKLSVAYLEAVERYRKEKAMELSV